MTTFTRRAVAVFASTDSNGDARAIDTDEVMQWGIEVESIDGSSSVSGGGAGLVYDTRSDLYADLDHDANTAAWVISDGTTAYVGVYQKSGESGSGSWSRVADLPYSFITATDAGAGTANAIVATTSIPVNDSSLIHLSIYRDNTGSATVTFNAESALDIKDASGNDVVASGLTAGMWVLGVISGTDFRLVSDQSAAQSLVTATAALAAVEDLRDSLSVDSAVKINTTTTDAVTDYELLSSVPVGRPELVHVHLGGVYQVPGDDYDIVAGGTYNSISLVENPGASATLVAVGAATISEVPVTGATAASDVEDDSALGTETVADALEALQAGIDAVDGTGNATPEVWTIADLKALNTSTHVAAHLRDEDRGGLFMFLPGNFAAKVALDTQNGIFVEADDASASLGAWVRTFGGHPNLMWFGAAGDYSVGDDDAIKGALAVVQGGVLWAPKGRYGVSNSIIVPANTTIIGDGCMDYWENDKSVGTVFQSIGPGTAARWTDITGSDADDDNPLFVAGGNNVWFRNLTVATESSSWTMGLLFPCVKQCGIQHVTGFNFTDGCLYLDATWSSRNTTLQDLHPEIETSSGMNEFYGSDFFFVGGGSGGFGIKIQGTTRSGTSVGSSSDWLWGYGGTSDIVFNRGRVGSSGSTSGGGFLHDAQLYGSTAFGQGITLRDVAFRTNDGGKYAAYFDRSNRIILDGCYGEGSSTPVINVTSNTQSGADGIIRINDKTNADIYVNGSDTGYTGSSVPWDVTRCLVTYRINQARTYTPNLQLPGENSGGIPRIISHNSSDAQVRFSEDGGSGVDDFFRISTTNIRPETDNSMTCGTGSFRFSSVAAATTTINTSDLREKDVVGLIAEDHALMAVTGRLRGKYIMFRWNDAVVKKGDAARIHFGIGAQDVEEAFRAEGLDPYAYAICCRDYLYDEVEEDTGEREPDGDVIYKTAQVPRLDDDGEHAYRLGLRHDLLHMLMMASYIQRQDDMEAAIAALQTN